MWQPAQILYPDVELLLTGLLRPRIHAALGASDVLVTDEIPNYATEPTERPRAERIVCIRSDGGPSLGDVRSLCRIGVNVFAADATDANALAALVAALLPGLAGEGPITAVTSVSLPSRVADPAPVERRYLTAELHLRGSVLS